MPSLNSYMESRGTVIPPAPTALDVDRLQRQISTLNLIVGSLQEKAREDRREIDRLHREIRTLREKLGEEE